MATATSLRNWSLRRCSASATCVKWAQPEARDALAAAEAKIARRHHQS